MAESSAPLGIPGQPWGDAERALWRAQRVRQRDYDAVRARIDALRGRFDVDVYGSIDAAPDRYPVYAVRSRDWVAERPLVLVTGGVHGYETSGVHGALAFLETRADDYRDRINLLVAPCVSPWAWERVQRWNAHAVDPNRSFRADSPAAEAGLLMRLVEPLRDRVLLHVDLHETTDSDETEFRPALAARDGKPFEPEGIPDGFYVVGDSENPQLAFQQAVIAGVSRVTHIAPADDTGQIIGSPVVAPGVILYPFRALGLCAGMTAAPYATTTEVYPDSPRATPAQCDAAQVAAVVAAIDHVLAAHRASPSARLS
jgi:hypothetical protein